MATIRCTGGWCMLYVVIEQRKIEPSEQVLLYIVQTPRPVVSTTENTHSYTLHMYAPTMHACTHTGKHPRTHSCAHTPTHACTPTHPHTHTHMRASAHAHIHTHTHKLYMLHIVNVGGCICNVTRTNECSLYCNEYHYLP